MFQNHEYTSGSEVMLADDASGECFIGCTCTSADLEEGQAPVSAEADCFIGCTCTSVDLSEEVGESQ